MIQPNPATWYSKEKDDCPSINGEHPNPFVSLFVYLICCLLGLWGLIVHQIINCVWNNLLKRLVICNNLLFFFKLTIIDCWILIVTRFLYKQTGTFSLGSHQLNCGL